MCAINGCTFRDRSLVERMNELTKHRGPDGTGIYEGEGVTLGANRLAIIDLSASASQPMKSADGRYVIAFNGEIYNYKELRRELSGYKFSNHSDTEVVLAGFAAWGTDVFEKLNGIFGLAIWDSEKKELFLARDSFGIKPLYVFREGNDVVFSSEAKAILAHANVVRSLDMVSLERYMRLGYVPGERTMFSNIQRIPGGHFVRIRGDSYEMHRFYIPYEGKKDLVGEDAHRALRESVDAAVGRQLVSDRPLGIFLSGGMDSSIVLDAAARQKDTVDTYSIGFEMPEGSEHESAKSNSDFELARRTAAHYGTRHHEYLLGTSGLPQLFEDSIYYMDEPMGSSTSLAQLALSRFAKKDVSVALFGDGGDELFGGYPRYLMSRRMDMYQRFVPAPLRALLAAHPALRQLNTPPGANRYQLFHFIKDKTLASIAPSLVNEHLLRDVEKKLASYDGLEFGDRFLRLDREWWLADEALLHADKMSMGASVEARVPLLDNEVVAVSDRIPLSEKVTMRETKRVLKEAFRGRLPEYLYSEPKRGFFPPAAKWMRVPEFSAYAREVLSPSYARATKDIFNWQGVEHMLTEHVEKRQYNLHALWSLLALQVWAHRFDIETP